MGEKYENIELIIGYWKESAELNYRTMLNLLKTGDLSWALFMGHLVIEKLLKAHYVRLTGHPAIMTHDLLRLSEKAGLSLPPQFAEWLDEITTFNINTRYDSYKQDFYRLCTKEFTDKWIKRIEEIRVWLTQQL